MEYEPWKDELTLFTRFEKLGKKLTKQPKIVEDRSFCQLRNKKPLEIDWSISNYSLKIDLNEN